MDNKNIDLDKVSAVMSHIYKEMMKLFDVNKVTLDEAVTIINGLFVNFYNECKTPVNIVSDICKNIDEGYQAIATNKPKSNLIKIEQPKIITDLSGTGKH
jgi:hypothetical protein